MIIPVGYAQVNVIYAGPGLPRGAEVAFGVANNGPDLTALEIAALVKNAYFDHIRPVATDQSSVVNYKCKLGPNLTGPQAELSSDDTGSGAYGDQTPQVALLVKKQTVLGGRHNQGRSYWPILGESLVTSGGFLLSAAAGTFQDAFDSFLADLSGHSIPMVLLHGDATEPTDVSSLSVQLLTATQRRRLRK